MNKQVENIEAINRTAWNRIAVEKKKVNPYEASIKQPEMLAEFIESVPKGSGVLDLGCGIGVPVTKKMSGSGLSVVGVDLSDEMIKQAQTNVPGAEFIRQSMTEIEFKHEFEGVVSSYSMLCLPPEEFVQVAEKVEKALKPGGFFLLVLNEATDGDRGQIEEIMGEEMFSRGITEAEVRRVFGDLGFTFEKTERETITTEEYGTEHTMLFLMRK